MVIWIDLMRADRALSLLLDPSRPHLCSPRQHFQGREDVQVRFLKVEKEKAKEKASPSRPADVGD
jgi:hypothetical protein